MSKGAHTLASMAEADSIGLGCAPGNEILTHMLQCGSTEAYESIA